MTSPTPGGGGRRTPPTADDLIGYSDELADMAMQIEDDEVGERLIHIAARMRSAAFAGVEAVPAARNTGFDPDEPHVARTNGTLNCELCGRIASDRLHDV